MEFYAADFIMNITVDSKSKKVTWKAEGHFVFNKDGMIEISFDARGTSFSLYVAWTENGYYALDINQNVCFPVVPYDLKWTADRAIKAYDSWVDAVSASHAIVKSFEAYTKRNSNEGTLII